MEQGSTPSQVLPGLFVGGWADSVHFEGQRICVRDEGSEQTARSDPHLPIYDAALQQPIRSNLDRVAELIDEARARGRPVLVYCGFGQRRAPLAAAWYLHRSLGIGIDEAYERIRRARPEIEHVREWISDWSALRSGHGSDPASTRSKGVHVG